MRVSTSTHADHPPLMGQGVAVPQFDTTTASPLHGLPPYSGPTRLRVSVHWGVTPHGTLVGTVRTNGVHVQSTGHGVMDPHDSVVESLPLHCAPPLAGAGLVQVRRRVQVGCTPHAALPHLQSENADHPPLTGHGVMLPHDTVCWRAPHASPPLAGATMIARVSVHVGCTPQSTALGGPRVHGPSTQLTGQGMVAPQLKLESVADPSHGAPPNFGGVQVRVRVHVRVTPQVVGQVQEDHSDHTPLIGHGVMLPQLTTFSTSVLHALPPLAAGRVTLRRDLHCGCTPHTLLMGVVSVTQSPSTQSTGHGWNVPHVISSDDAPSHGLPPAGSMHVRVRVHLGTVPHCVGHWQSVHADHMPGSGQGVMVPQFSLRDSVLSHCLPPLAGAVTTVRVNVHTGWTPHAAAGVGL